MKRTLCSSGKSSKVKTPEQVVSQPAGATDFRPWEKVLSCVYGRRDFKLPFWALKSWLCKARYLSPLSEGPQDRQMFQHMCSLALKQSWHAEKMGLRSYSEAVKLLSIISLHFALNIRQSFIFPFSSHICQEWISALRSPRPGPCVWVF